MPQTRSTLPPATWLVDKIRKIIHLTMVLFLALVLPGCGEAKPARSDPSDTAISFVNAYDRWAQKGFSMPLPEELNKLSNDNSKADLEADSRWYSQGNVKQVGSIRFTDVKVVSSSETSSTVSIVMDYSNVELVANGLKVNFDQDQGSKIEIYLVRESSNEDWRVDSVNKP